MAYIVSVGKCLPECNCTQETTVEFAKEMFKETFKDIDRLLIAFQNGEIKTRQFAKELDWYKQDHSFKEKNDTYITNAVTLGVKAIKACLSNSRLLSNPVDYEEIDAIFFISSTGISTPSIDAKIINELPFKDSIKRIPIWGLGCAGGAAGLSRAFEYCKAFPDAKVIVLSVEFCSLTFQRDDQSKSNLIGTSLFADGVACTCIIGEAVDQKRYSKLKNIPRILGTKSTMMKNSEEVMGWDIKNNGFYVVFSRDIPSLINKWLKPNVESFLDDYSMNLTDISHFVAHPGGKKVLDAYKQGLEFTDFHLHISKEVLSKHGNMSSVTVMYVLEAYLEREVAASQEYGLIGALGPGFSSELLLVKWEEV